MWHGFCTSITHIYSGILSGITTFYVAWVLYFHYTHIYIYICSGILSGITTSYVAWVLYFHYTYIFWHSIWHHTTFYVAWVLYFHYTHIFWHSIWHHNILFGVYSGLMSHTYILTFYLYDGIHMNSDKTQELAVLYIAYCIYKYTKQELKLSRTMAWDTKCMPSFCTGKCQRAMGGSSPPAHEWCPELQDRAV